MRLGGILGLGAGLFAALLLQAALFSGLRLPLAAPDLLLVVVAALGLALGPRIALVAGFAVGLAADVIPPAAHAVGRQAFVLCLVGYLVGRVAAVVKGSALRPILLVAAFAALTPFLYALLGVAVGDGHDRWGALLPAAAGAALYAAVLAPFVVPLTQAVCGRGEPRGISTLTRPSVARSLPRDLSKGLSKGR
jgi:rod shape-determining protein MreD